MYKYLIIGGGITGITIARLLQQKGEKNFLVIESEREAGGLCRTKEIDGHVLDIGGGHFLYSKYQEVYDFIFSHIDKTEFNYFDRISKIKIGDNLVDYPLESNLWQLPIEAQVKYLISSIQSGEITGKKEPINYAEWIRWKLGEEVALNYMIPYNRKIWGVEPTEMDIDWLYKIPRLNTNEILLSCLLHNKGIDKVPSHPGFFYPKKGGFQAIFDSIYNYVHESVVLGEPVVSLKKGKKGWLVNNKYEAETIINTAPWPKLYKALGSPSALNKEFKNLMNNQIVVSLWEENYSHNVHWIYDPDLEIERHRDFFIHNFAPNSKKNGMYTETNVKRWPGKNKKWSNGKKPLFEYVNEAAYPIPTIGNAKSISAILNHYKNEKLYGVGRWGQWQYLNSDVCIYEAMKFVNSLVKNA